MFEWCVVSFAVFISITSAFYIVTFIYRGYLKKYYYAERKVLMDEFNLVGMRLNLKYLTVSSEYILLRASQPDSLHS